MTQGIFVDTGAWYAALVRKDNDHQAAKQFLMNNKLPLITSDYVMDETVTLLQSRIDHTTAIRFIDMLQTSRNTQLLYLTPLQITASIALFRNRPDKGWSFTDCTSFIMMQEYNINLAFAFDVHFHQAGFQVKPTRIAQ